MGSDGRRRSRSSTASSGASSAPCSQPTACLRITADHGNAEEKLDTDGNPLTAHTTNPVPLVIVSREPLGTLADGRLGDVAPTLLPLLGVAVPPAMSGNNLLAPLPATLSR